MFDFFLDVCFCLCFCCSFCSFQREKNKFFFGQNFNFSSNDTAVATAAVELNIRTIILLLLLTLKIVYYSRELSVQQTFVEQFSIQHLKISGNGHRFFGQPHYIIS